MKRQLIISGAILLGALSLSQTSQCVGYFEQSQAILGCAGSEDGGLERILNRDAFSQFQYLLIKLDKDKEGFFSNKGLVEELSGYLKKFSSSIKKFEIQDASFYYGPTNCTYYHKEKYPLHPNAEIGTRLMDLATTIRWEFSLKHQPSHTQEIKLKFTDLYRNALTLVITQTPTGDRIDIKDNDIRGVIAYITSNYQADPQKRKFHIEKILAIDKLLRQLDSDPDFFINGPENIHTLVDTLWTLISAIDIYQIDQYGTKTLFSPNYMIIEKLLNIENQINTLINARQLEKSVVDTFAAIYPYSIYLSC